MTAPPLAGLVVLDLSRVLAGPWCTMVLSDLGAEVIKVENPKGGDDTRHWGPPWAGDQSAYYLCANRNKRSIAVDIANPAGQAIIRDLAMRADVMVENYKLGGLDKYGLDPTSLMGLNPALIACSISGYGRMSPRAAEPGYDYAIQAEGGMMAANGEPDGDPMRVGVAVADLFTGMSAAQAILAALIARDRDGLGQHIDMALYDCQLAMLANVGSAALVSGEEPPRLGNGHATIVPYQSFSAADRHIVVAVGNDRQFRALAALIGRPELADDPRFATNPARVANRKALIAELLPIFAARPAEDWLAGLRAAGVPCGAVRGVAEALNAPETLARRMVRMVEHPTAGALPLVGSPLALSRTPVAEPAPPPLLGGDRDAILAQTLGWNEARIAEALLDGAFG